MEKWHINWQDGMKVNKQHFLGMEMATRNELLQHISVFQGSYNYGLVPSKGSGSAWDLFFKLDQSNEIVLNLLACKAITPGGAFINITPTEQHLSEFRIGKSKILERLQNSKDASLYVVLNLDVFNKKPFGEVIKGELPPRQPHSVPTVYMTTANFQEVSHALNSGLSQLIIGRIILRENQLVLDAQYIPPCVTTNAYPRLLELFDEWARMLENTLFTNLKNTLTRVDQIEREAEQTIAFSSHGRTTSLTDSVRILTISIMEALASLIPELKVLREQPFIFTLAGLQKLAWGIKVRYSTMSIANRNNLENYFVEALGLRDFIEKIDKFIEVKYQHDRIDIAVQHCQVFLSVLRKIYHEETGLPTKKFDWTKQEGTIVIEETEDKPKRTID